MNSRPLRIWLLTNAPSPYQAELFTAIARDPGIDLNVQFMRSVSSSGVAAASEFRGRTLRRMWPRWFRDEFQLHPQAIRDVLRGNYDCFILSGLYTSLTFQLCATILKLMRRPWCVWLERPRSKSRLSKGPLRKLKNLVLNRTLASADQVWCIGSLAQQEYKQRAGNTIQTSVLPYCCDTRRYTNTDTDAVEQVKDRYKLHGQIVFLFSGQLIYRKGVDILLAAFERVATKHPQVRLLILGDGPLRESLEQQVSRDLKTSVIFTGYIDQKNLPAHFLAADVFVFPSRHDGWGVVVNEACAAGLPIIATSQTGSVFDLVEEGQSGFLVECDNVDELAQKMALFCEHPEWIKDFGNRSRELVERFSAENGAKLFHKNIHRMLQRIS